MDQQTITTKEMLAEIERKDADGNPVPFSFQYVTFNRNSRKGGKLKGYDDVTQATSSGKAIKKYDGTDTATKRNPNHTVNMTRNFFVGAETRPRTFNLRGITRFNGKKVVY